VVTLNILNDLSYWDTRRSLIVDQLDDLQPDVICLQEVNCRGDGSNAHWIAEQLNHSSEDKPFSVFLAPKTGIYEKKEAIALLSRVPVKRHEVLDLLTQNRVAQLAELRVDGESILLVNGHFYWECGESTARQKQIELLLDWLDTQPVELPVVICGDFNGTPESAAIKRMKQYFDSAYNIVHGQEPKFTCPTPLPRSKRVVLRSLVSSFFGKRPPHDPDWHDTLDYIFVDPRLKVEDCCLVLNTPAADDVVTYPSDHFGLMAEIKVSE
jgi:endonuclease/exonuclease/phosphatase family metal-dependent hydrolase